MNRQASPASRRPLRVTRWHAGIALALLVALVLWLAATAGRRKSAMADRMAVPVSAEDVTVAPGERSAPAGTGPTTETASAPLPGTASSGIEPDALPQRPVTLHWPRADGRALVPLDAEIFETAAPLDQLEQVVGLLLAGPTEEGIVAPFPEGVLLRAVFLDRFGTAYVSLSSEAVSKAPGGSDWELLATYSIVNSLVDSFPEVRRVQILIEGEEVETLAGHLGLLAPLVRNARLVASPASP